MKTGNEGFQQCYNAQAAVDAELAKLLGLAAWRSPQFS